MTSRYMNLTDLDLCATSRYWNKNCVNLTQKLHHVIPTRKNSNKNGDHFSKSLNTNIKNSKNYDVGFANQSKLDTNLRYCKKIRIYPCQEQILIFNKCLGANRYFYNQANSYIKNTYVDSKKIVLSRIKIRDAVLIPDSKLTPEMLWQKEIPYDTRQFAIDQVRAAYKSNLELIKGRENKIFDVNYKTKRATTQIFQINKKAINFSNLTIFKTRCKKKLRVRKRDLIKLQDECDGNVTCLKIKFNKWYLCLPRTRELPMHESAPYKSVFLDPGVRTFQTYYSPDGVSGKLGREYEKNYIQPLLAKIDCLESIRSQSKLDTRYRIKKRLCKIRDKVKNRVNDLHNKSCKFLCDNFDTIFLPKFETQQMVSKSPGRVISKKTVRNLLELAHYRFKVKLEVYSKTKGRQLIHITENYTTKTCGTCGAINDIGGSKTYICACGYMADRDYHGARNICIKILSSAF